MNLAGLIICICYAAGQQTGDDDLVDGFCVEDGCDARPASDEFPLSSEEQDNQKSIE